MKKITYKEIPTGWQWNMYQDGKWLCSCDFPTHKDAVADVAIMAPYLVDLKR